jgi:hypothetical protein
MLFIKVKMDAEAAGMAVEQKLSIKNARRRTN